MIRLRVVPGVAALALFGAATAGDPSPADSDAAGGSVAAAIELRVDGEPAHLVEKPVLKFGDPARENEGGTVWIWTRPGRPAAVMEMYVNSRTRSRIQVITSLADGPITAEGGDGFAWRPQTAGAEFRAIAGPLPAEDAARRLSQMKAIARRFRGHEFWDPGHSRYELRLMPRPVFRYADEGRGVADGAVFLLAHGTNPEIAVALEAARLGDGEAGWRLAAARLGHAELHLLDGETEIWHAERVAETMPEDPYHLFYLDPPATRAAESSPR